MSAAQFRNRRCCPLCGEPTDEWYEMTTLPDGARKCLRCLELTRIFHAREEADEDHPAL